MSVTYARINFRNRIVKNARAYIEEANQDGSINHTPAPGEVYQSGTKLNDGTLNAMDKGIDDCAKAINNLEELVKKKQDKLIFDNTPTEGSANPVTSGGVKAALDAKIVSYTATIPATGWTPQNGGVCYTRSVVIAGLLAADKPDVGIVQTGTWATDEAIRDAWACVTRITAATNALQITADAIPGRAIPIQVRCIR